MAGVASFPAAEDGRGSPSPTKRFESSSPQHQQQQQQQQQQDLLGSHRDGHEEQSLESPSSRSPPTSTLPRMVPVVSRQLPPRDAPPTAASKRQWAGPGKTNTVVNGLTFRSDFDSGNLMKVVALPAEQEGADGVYQLWTARDCEGGPNTKRNSSWFYFGVAGGSRDQIISMRLMNLNNQNALYKHGMTPVFRLSGNPLWTRLKQKVTFEEEGRHLKLQFQFRFTRDSEEVLFAFCFPHSYEDCERDLERCEDQARRGGMAVQALLTPKAGPTGYYHRELLIRTPEGRRVDLITVTDCHGILDERESRIDPHLFPELPRRRRPFKFEGKDIVFVSARVHPGETPASFVFQGILRFLLDSIDPRAAELRRRFVFKLVPLMNPDGVAAGHFRQDSYGNNLNRHYADPHPEKHASVYAAKAVVMHHAARPVGRGRLTLYLDLHAHASSRGCFMYGNHLPMLEDQVENQLLPLLMSLNTPHFDFPSCNFTLKHMSRVDSGDGGLSAEGTGRVFYGKNAGVLRSYTLECNYNTGKVNCNHIPPASGGKGRGFASPERKATPAPRYNPDVWRDVGAGFLKALLDAEGASVWSRLPQSKLKSLDRARRFLTNELRSQPSYREQSLLLRQGVSGTPPTLAPPPSTGLRSTASSPPPSSRTNGSAHPPLSRRKSECAMGVACLASDSATPSPHEAALGRDSRPPPLVLPRRAGRTPPAQGRGKAVWKTGCGGGGGGGGSGGGGGGGGNGGGGDAITTVLAAASTKTSASARQSLGGSRTRLGSAKTNSGAVSTLTCVEGASSTRSGRRGRAACGKRGTRRQSPHHPERSLPRDMRKHSTRHKRAVMGVQGSRCGGSGESHGKAASSHSDHRKNVAKTSTRLSCRSRSRRRRAPSSTGTPPEAPVRVLEPLPATATAGAASAASTPPARGRRIRQPQPTMLSLSTRHNKRSGSLQPAPGWELEASGSAL